MVSKYIIRNIRRLYNQEWILSHRYHLEYLGKWIVLDGGRLVTYHSTLREILEKITQEEIKERDYQIVKLPTE